MKGGRGPTKLLHPLTWGAFDHASHAPQVRACNSGADLGSFMRRGAASEHVHELSPAH